MHSIDYRLANALQERRLDESSRLHGDSQDSHLAEPQRRGWRSRQLRLWLYGLGGHLVEFGGRLVRQPLAVQAGQE